jgi:hypothetical protein
MTYINHTNLQYALVEIKHVINQLDYYNYIFFILALAINIYLILLIKSLLAMLVTVTSHASQLLTQHVMMGIQRSASAPPLGSSPSVYSTSLP